MLDQRKIYLSRLHLGNIYYVHSYRYLINSDYIYVFICVLKN